MPADGNELPPEGLARDLMVLKDLTVDSLRPATDSTSDIGRADVLRVRMEADGYLLLRGVVPLGAVAEVRGGIVEVLDQAGLVGAPKGDDRTGAAAVVPARAGVVVDVHGDAALFRPLYSLEALHRLPHHEAILGLAQALLGEDVEVLVHPRPALRVVFPGSGAFSGATPPHQDHLGMQGTERTFTIWIPLVNCPRSAGVLAVAEGSHRGGVRPYLALPGSRVAGCDASDLAGRWVAADLEPGDLLVFHSLTVHSALPNASPEVRLSLDARYQAADAPVCEATLGDPPHLNWDEVYTGWSAESSHLQRYWTRLATNVVAFDATRLVGGGARESSG